MKRVLLSIILPIFLFLPNTSFSAQKNYIYDIDLSSRTGGAQVSIESTSSPKYRSFTMSNPPRLVIDIQNSRLHKKIDFSSGRVFKKLLMSDKKNGELRIVLHLGKEAQISKTSISAPGKKGDRYQLLVNISIDESGNGMVNESILHSHIADNILGMTNPPKKKKLKKKPIIVIDAGHGGKDPGAIGHYARTKEKNITLAYAKEIKRYLDKTGLFRTYLTRDKDYFISLGGRVQKSRKLKADLFISVHADSAENRKAKGLSIYTLSKKSSDKHAALLAAKENKADIIGGVNFSNTSGDILTTLISMSQRSSMNSSAKFAELAIKNLDRGGIDVVQNTHRFAGFRVLTAPDVTAVLIELGYLSNKKEERSLNSVHHRRKVAKSLVISIRKYFNR